MTLQLNPDTLTPSEKKLIAFQIKPILLTELDKEIKLLQDWLNDPEKYPIKEQSCIGNKIVDYFTFVQRLETKGKYNVNYFDFIQNKEYFSQKKFIQTMVTYYEEYKNKQKKKNIYLVWKEIYNICISAINIIRPLVYMKIFMKYKPTCILDFCAGWGGAMIGACFCKIPKYIGIEINKSLEPCYQNLETFLISKKVLIPEITNINMMFKDALTVDYSKLNYDFVFTSPPYYFIQKYKDNALYNNSKQEMDEQFYIPLFSRTFLHLKQGGTYILNINQEIYTRVCIPLLGEAQDSFVYQKRKRQNNYQEKSYVWIK